MALKRTLFATALALGWWPGCRAVSVCDDGAPCAERSAGGGAFTAPVAGNTGEGPAGGAPAASPVGGAGQTFDDAGESGAGGQPVEINCRPARADCDGSTLTYCETPLNFSFLHCGECGLRCDGVCVSGRCKPATELAQTSVDAFAVRSLHGFSVVSEGESYAVLRISLQDGATLRIVGGLGVGRVYVGGDRVYWLEGGELISVDIAGNGRRSEELRADSFAATDDAIYYVDYVWDREAEVDEGTLFYRPNVVGEATPLFTADVVAILDASPEALLVERTVEGKSELVLVEQSEVWPLGERTNEIRHVRVVESVAYLMEVDDDGLYQLSVRAPAAEARVFELSNIDPSQPMILAPGGVAVGFKEGLFPYMQTFDRFGSGGIALGTATYTLPLYLDEQFLWYSWFASPNHAALFLRARQLEFSDLDID